MCSISTGTTSLRGPNCSIPIARCRPHDDVDMPSDMPTDPIDVDRARAATPGCELGLHLNHAGTSLAPRPVLDAQIEWLEAEALSGGYELAADREADHQTTSEQARATSA